MTAKARNEATAVVLPLCSMIAHVSCLAVCLAISLMLHGCDDPQASFLFIVKTTTPAPGAAATSNFSLDMSPRSPEVDSLSESTTTGCDGTSAPINGHDTTCGDRWKLLRSEQGYSTAAAKCKIKDEEQVNCACLPCTQDPNDGQIEVVSTSASTANTKRSSCGSCGLSVVGTKIMFKGKTVFLSGLNQQPDGEWASYRIEFGNRNYWDNRKDDLLQTLIRVQRNGGNTVRLWTLFEGQEVPMFDDNGMTVRMDRQGSWANEVSHYATLAAEKNIIVMLCLWNGASGGLTTSSNWEQFKNLIWDDSKLQSFIDNALKKAARQLKHHTNIVWEIINEPEGSVRKDDPDSVDCYNTVGLGASWTGAHFPMKRLQRFINWQAAAIKREAPCQLVTIGSWSMKGNTAANSQLGTMRNYWSDNCLKMAGGMDDGVLDFYQTHSYDFGQPQQPYKQWEPFNHAFAVYNLDKPLIIGEFSEKSHHNDRSNKDKTYREQVPDGWDAKKQFGHLYDNGYSGALYWAYKHVETHSNALSGMSGIQGRQKLDIDAATCLASEWEECILNGHRTPCRAGLACFKQNENWSRCCKENNLQCH